MITVGIEPNEDWKKHNPYQRTALGQIKVVSIGDLFAMQDDIQDALNDSSLDDSQRVEKISDIIGSA